MMASQTSKLTPLTLPPALIIFAYSQVSVRSSLNPGSTLQPLQGQLCFSLCFETCCSAPN